MRIKKSNVSIVLGAALVTVVILFSMLFSNMQVASQKGETEQNKNVSNSQPGKENRDDDGVQEFIKILTSDDREIPPARKVDAIKHLGDSKAPVAISILAKYLDYEDKSIPVRNVDSINITEQDDVSPSKRFPAIGSLVQFGKAALPALVGVIEKEPTGTMRSKNANIAVRYIFLRENVMDGIIYLEKAASESNVPEGSQRLLTAANELRKLLEKVQE